MGRPGTFTSRSGGAATKRRTKGKGKGKDKSRKAPSKAAAEEAAAERERASASGKRANKARTDGSVKKVNPSPCDLEARAEAAQPREAWENAMDLMRKRGTGWVHSRVVEGKMVVLLAQQFKKEGGKILLARRLKRAVACGGDEAAGCGYVVEYGDEAEGVVDDAELLEEDKVDDGDEGWLVQVVGGGSAGDGAKKVPVKKKVWWQHRPIIMGSVGKRLLSIKPADLAGALAGVLWFVDGLSAVPCSVQQRCALTKTTCTQDKTPRPAALQRSRSAARSQKKHALPTPSLRLLHPSPGDHQCTFYFPHTIPGSHPHHAP